MKTKDFLKQHSACIEGAKWALSIGEEMVDIWNAMVEQGKYEWLMWTATRPGVFSDSVLRKLTCRVVRETPLSDGRKVWNLLTDERSRKAVEVAETYADGKATYEELDAACAAARDAYYTAAAYDAADAAAYAATAAAYDAAYAAADAAARDAAAFAAARDAAADAAAYAATAAVYDADASYAAYAAAKVAQMKMIAELCNPFKEERAGK